MLCTQVKTFAVSWAEQSGATWGQVEPEKFDMVTILFSDIVGFTNISAAMTPMKVMAMLDSLYIHLDSICTECGLFKVETIGDA